MAEITNLNQYRKQRKKEEKRKAGASNKVRKGRTKLERFAEKFSAERRDLDMTEKNSSSAPVRKTKTRIEPRLLRSCGVITAPRYYFRNVSK